MKTANPHKIKELKSLFNEGALLVFLGLCVIGLCVGAVAAGVPWYYPVQAAIVLLVITIRLVQAEQ